MENRQVTPPSVSDPQGRVFKLVFEKGVVSKGEKSKVPLTSRLVHEFYIVGDERRITGLITMRSPGGVTKGVGDRLQAEKNKVLMNMGS